jgi:hypothetical protein
MPPLTVIEELDVLRDRVPGLRARFVAPVIHQKCSIGALS